ncbi:cytochrome P450 [Paraburkholderia sediminicola]|uniref:cytochrome P450 n=1 Tax=Paraburkholderia TaxID=1822464 RepID=UPI0038BB1C99
MNIDNLDLNEDSLLPLILGTGFNDPYPVYDHLRSACPVHRDASGIWLVSPHALVTRILDDRNFSARPPSPMLAAEDPLGYLGMVVFETGDQHERLRRLLAPLFTRKRLADLQQFIDAEILRLLAPLRQTKRFDLIADVARVLPVRTICHLLGFPESAARTYLKASMGAWRLISAASLSTEERAQAVDETRRFLDQIESFVAEVDSDKTPDHPILYFRQLEESGDVDHGSMLANILFLFIAGYGTTLLSIGNSVAAAMRHPETWQALCGDCALIPQAARELQRYDPAVQAIFRYAWKDVEVGDQLIRRGEQVALLLGAANRDPDEFALPNNIDLYRTRGRSLTFGAGPHSCMGLALARMQLESLLRELPRHMPDLTLSGADNYRLQRGAFHGFSQLLLDHSVITDRHSANST